MAFRTNSYQQMSIQDSFNVLTPREQKALEKSWAKVFAEVLYSQSSSRPNTPVNICIRALIIKELFGSSDDEMVENLMLDPRYQYALHTTSWAEQSLSNKSISRYRRRCYDYECSYGVDLLHDGITSQAGKIARIMEVMSRIKRRDSMMITANIRKLSRSELLYTCVAKLVLYLHRNKQDSLVE